MVKADILKNQQENATGIGRLNIKHSFTEKSQLQMLVLQRYFSKYRFSRYVLVKHENKVTGVSDSS